MREARPADPGTVNDGRTVIGERRAAVWRHRLDWLPGTDFEFKDPPHQRQVDAVNPVPGIKLLPVHPAMTGWILPRLLTAHPAPDAAVVAAVGVDARIPARGIVGTVGSGPDPRRLLQRPAHEDPPERTAEIDMETGGAIAQAPQFGTDPRPHGTGKTVERTVPRFVPPAEPAQAQSQGIVPHHSGKGIDRHRREPSGFRFSPQGFPARGIRT